MENYERLVDSKLNKLARKVPVIDAIGERAQNMTTEDWARAAAQAYKNLKYDIKHINVINGATGEPIEDATIQVYENDWYSFYYNATNVDEVFTTDVNGTTTEEGKFERDLYYYVNVTAPGFSSNST